MRQRDPSRAGVGLARAPGAGSPVNVLLAALVLIPCQAPVSWVQERQATPAVQLLPANARASHEFVQVSAIRELANGHVLVLDRASREQPIVVVDFENDKTMAIGRRGAGPGEFQVPLSLVPLGGDSSLITDGMLGRWLILSGSTIVGVQSADRQPVATLGVFLNGGDHKGHILSLRGFRTDSPSQPADTFADSSIVILGHVTEGLADTIARVPASGARMQPIKLVGPGTEGYPGYIMPNPLLMPDQAVLFPDGWVALAHVAPYRVDWREPSGRWVRGRPLPFAATSATEPERRAAMTRAFPRLETEGTPTTVFADWPSALPPFLRDALVPLPSGLVMIRRTPIAGEGTTRYDVVNRRGELAQILTMANAERLVGVGKRGAYVTTTDGDGHTLLQRHPFHD